MTITTPTTTPEHVITLSHSQIETWQQCPRRWRLTKIDRARQAPAEALIFGDAVHQAIEADGSAAVRGDARLGLPALVARFSLALTTRFAEDDPHGLLHGRKRELRLRGLALLRAYCDQVQPTYHPTEVEAPFPSLLIPPAQRGEPMVRFTGRIDARAGDQGATIIDFKTSSKPWPLGIEHEKAQATAYLMADRLANRQPPAQAVRFIVFTATATATARGDAESGGAGSGGYDVQVASRETTRDRNQRGAFLAHVRTTATLIAQARERNVFPAAPGPLCGWCGVLGSCDVGQRWLAARGRTPAVPMVDGQTGAPLP